MYSLEAIAALGYAVTTALVLLPLAHVGLHDRRIQLLILHGEAGIGLRMRRSAGSERQKEINLDHILAHLSCPDTHFVVRLDCSEPVLIQDADDMVDLMLPEAMVPRFSRSPVLRCLRIFRPCTQKKITFIQEQLRRLSSGAHLP